MSLSTHCNFPLSCDERWDETWQSQKWPTMDVSGGSKSEKRGGFLQCSPCFKESGHFSSPATFQSIEIDLFVMKGGPFRILRACNLCEMGVSLRKTGRQRLKNDRRKEESGRDWDEKEDRLIVLIWPLVWLSKTNLDRLLSLSPWAEQHRQAVTADKRLLLRAQARCIFKLTQANGGKAALLS